MRTKEYLPKKISLALNSPDFGGRSSRNEARFSGVTRNVLSNSKHTLLCAKAHHLKLYPMFINDRIAIASASNMAVCQVCGQ